MIQLLPHNISIEENERVGSENDCPGLPQLVYIKLYGTPKSVSIVSVREIPVASIPAFPIVTVYFTTWSVVTESSASLSVFETERIGNVVGIEPLISISRKF
jgi:hypothetical protein